MNNSELDDILKKARAPERSEEFFEMFPQQVVRQLKRAETRRRHAERRWFPRLAWGLVTAACLLAAFAIGHWRGRVETNSAAENDVLQNTKFVERTLAMFPNRVRAIVHDQRGWNLVLSSQSDVPASSPIYVRVCDGKNCSSCVTFSGQEIQIAGQKMTVLSDARGGVILEGDRFVWSSDGNNYVEKKLKIEARNLNLTTL